MDRNNVKIFMKKICLHSLQNAHMYSRMAHTTKKNHNS